MALRIDGSLYPDEEPPDRLESEGDRIDFIARLCSAWDFGFLPEPATVAELRRPEWRSAVDATRLLTSPTYHLLREWHRLPEVEFLGSLPALVTGDPQLQFV